MTSILDAVKIQARAVAPIVKALEEKLGKEEAHQLVGDAIAKSWADFSTAGLPDDDHPRDVSGGDFPVESVIVTDTDDEYRIHMTSCEFANYFRSRNMPEIGALLTCGVDYEVYKRRSKNWEFTRPQTLMMGADYCDFCYKKAT